MSFRHVTTKLRHILGSLAFSECNIAKKYTLRWSNPFLKTQCKINFLPFLNIDQNSSKKYLEQKYGPYLFTSSFKIKFRHREVVKLKIRKYAYLHIFRLPTSWSQKFILKIDLKWEGPYFYSKFFVGEFQSILKSSKIGFHIVFSKNDLTAVGYIFWRKIFLKKPNFTKICLGFGGSIPEAQTKQCQLTPPPPLLKGVHPVGCWTQPFQSSNLIMDIATYRLNQPRGKCSENHLKYITRWVGRDGVTITIFSQNTRDGQKTSYL